MATNSLFVLDKNSAVKFYKRAWVKSWLWIYEEDSFLIKKKCRCLANTINQKKNQEIFVIKYAHRPKHFNRRAESKILL